MRPSNRHLGSRGAVVLAMVLATTLVPVALAGASPFAPGAPQGVHVSEVGGVTEVRWSPPASNGGAPVRRYVVVAHPASPSCVAKKTLCVVAHLTPSATYTFTVVAQNAAGVSAPSAPSNRFRVPSAKKSFLSAVTALDTALSSAQQAIDAATTTAQLTVDLAKYKGAYGAFTSVLRDDGWPAAARGDIASLATDVAALANDTNNAYLASATTAASLFVTLQIDNNKEVEVDAKVRSDLGLPQLITGPITTAAPTPVSVGAAQTIHDFVGDALPVTVTQIVDPATAGAGSGLADAGYRFVAVEMSLTDPSGGEAEGNANFSTTVLGSDNKTYTADFGTASECTNFIYGLFDLFGGDSASGCVLFELPTSVTVQAVFFSLAPGYLDTVEWVY